MLQYSYHKNRFLYLDSLLSLFEQITPTSTDTEINQVINEIEDFTFNLPDVVSPQYPPPDGYTQTLFSYRSFNIVFSMYIILSEEYNAKEIITYDFSVIPSSVQELLKKTSAGIPIVYDEALENVRTTISAENINNTVTVTSDIPTLMFSGGADFQTPVAWANYLETEKKFSKYKHYVFPFEFHVFSLDNTCAVGIIDSFLKNVNSFEQIDENCYTTEQKKHENAVLVRPTNTE